MSDPHRQEMIDGRHDFCNDPHFIPLRASAKHHYDLGIPLQMYNGLIKLYRRVYLKHFSHYKNDLTTVAGCATLPQPEAFAASLDEFFDKAELVCLLPWSDRTPEDAALSDSLRRVIRERDRYFTVFECLRDPVFIVGADDKLITANQPALDTFLFLSETGALTYWLALQEHRATLQSIADEILGTPGHEWDAIWMQTRLGKRCFDIRVRELDDAADKLEPCRLILLHDVTEHYKALQQAREAERAMSLFLATMAHEIRAPLHSVLGAASLMRDAVPSEVPKLGDLLSISARSLSTTLDNVLSFSRFAYQAPEPHPTVVSPAQALHDLVRVKDVLARQQGVPLQLQIAPDVPAVALLDWSMVQQILGNLLQNALRHDDGRGVMVTLEYTTDTLVFQIADHGHGLDPDIRAMLEAPPVELRPRATGMNGTGLGLGIAQRMTLALGGRLTALDCNEGALLELRLPLEQPVQHFPQSVQVNRDALFEFSCLLVDDDPINALVTVAMLERMGISVDHANTLEQAYSLCEVDRSAYSVFIVDGRLPDGTGVEFAKYLRRDPILRKAPILLLSANVEWICASTDDSSLFAALLEKPLDADSLEQAIRTGIQPKRKIPSDFHMLEGISPDVRLRMAEAFATQCAEFVALLATDEIAADGAGLAARAHKLASGAATFGLRDTAAALIRFERTQHDPRNNALTLANIHALMRACTLPQDWASRAGMTA
ncbi:ATP-binding protein [Cupriavidus metallidurans]|uniref:ATP-binding protein n=1 Tax=Cupriavidus metallidurans TaxID=119219 RepID=UPI00167529B5|nr:ATP-binding protein [Cupriavidus metallidurans]